MQKNHLTKPKLIPNKNFQQMWNERKFLQCHKKTSLKNVWFMSYLTVEH